LALARALVKVLAAFFYSFVRKGVMKGRVAWLITMVPGRTEEVIAILNCRCSGSTVANVMEHLYIMRRCDPSVVLAHAVTGKTPYPAQYSIVDGVSWTEELMCGSGDRRFWARKVDSLRVEDDGHGREIFKWSERKRPDLRDVAEAWKLDQKK